jgi:hypothetical protein
MPCFSNLDYRSRGNDLTVKSLQTTQRTRLLHYADSLPILCRLLALLLALAVAAPVLLAQDHDNDRDQGRFVDPIVGSWIVHVTVDNPPPALKVDNLSAFLAEGIIINSDPTEGTSCGVWKKTSPSTYFVKFIQINPEGTITTISGPTILNPEGNQQQGTFQGKVTDSTGQTVFAQFSGRTKLNRITFTSKP